MYPPKRACRLTPTRPPSGSLSIKPPPRLARPLARRAGSGGVRGGRPRGDGPAPAGERAGAGVAFSRQHLGDDPLAVDRLREGEPDVEVAEEQLAVTGRVEAHE